MNLHVRKSFVVLVAMLAGSAGSALAAPVIASITPSSGSTVGGVMLTISGASFSASARGFCFVAFASRNAKFHW